MKLRIPLILSSLFLSCCLQNRKPFDFQHANIKSVIFRNHQFEFRKSLKTESEITEFKSQLMFLERAIEIPQNYGENWTHRLTLKQQTTIAEFIVVDGFMILVKVILHILIIN